jgi:hypothetical protein
VNFSQYGLAPNAQFPIQQLFISSKKSECLL